MQHIWTKYGRVGILTDGKTRYVVLKQGEASMVVGAEDNDFDALALMSDFAKLMGGEEASLARAEPEPSNVIFVDAWAH